MTCMWPSRNSTGKKRRRRKSRRKFRAEAFTRNHGFIFIFESKLPQKLPEQVCIAVGGSNSSSRSGGSSSQENSHSHIISFRMHVDPSATQLLQLYSRTMCLLGKCHQFDAERPSYINTHNGQEPWDSVTLTERLSATNNNVCVHRFNLWRGFFSFFLGGGLFFAVLASHARKGWRHEDELMSGWNNDTCTHSFGCCCRCCCCL